MRKQGGSFGVVILVVVVAVVLFLAARAWQDAAPAALAVASPEGPAAAVDDRGQTEAGDELRQGNLPDLNQMRSQTHQHSQQVQDAMAQIE